VSFCLEPDALSAPAKKPLEPFEAQPPAPIPPPDKLPLTGVVTPLPAPPRLAAAALRDEQQEKQRLLSLRTQLRNFGPMGAAIQALAVDQTTASRRQRKHTKLAARGVASESEWWGCLLESFGLALPDLPADERAGAVGA